jgi:hypothetical protein
MNSRTALSERSLTVEGLPASFEGVVVFFEVVCVDGLVVLGGDAVLGEVFGDVVGGWMVVEGSVVGPDGVDPELQEVAGECLGPEGLVVAVEEPLAGEVCGQLGRVRLGVQVLVEVLPGQVVAVDGGEAAWWGCRPCTGLGLIVCR